jgi:hypothetical protein
LEQKIDGSITCNCPFKGCERPARCWDTASNGVIVTWSRLSAEADMARVIAHVRGFCVRYGYLPIPLDAGVDPASVVVLRDSNKPVRFFCPGCYQVLSSTTSGPHLLYEGKRLSDAFNTILLERQLEPGKSDTCYDRYITNVQKVLMQSITMTKLRNRKLLLKIGIIFTVSNGEGRRWLYLKILML